MFAAGHALDHVVLASWSPVERFRAGRARLPGRIDALPSPGVKCTCTCVPGFRRQRGAPQSLTMAVLQVLPSANQGSSTLRTPKTFAALSVPCDRTPGLGGKGFQNVSAVLAQPRPNTWKTSCTFMDGTAETCALRQVVTAKCAGSRATATSPTRRSAGRTTDTRCGRRSRECSGCQPEQRRIRTGRHATRAGTDTAVTAGT